MSPRNKKTLESIKNETIIPLGFYEHNSAHSIFCRIKELPGKIYLIPGKRNELNRFSEYKELVVFKNRFLDEKINLEDIDDIISSVVNHKKIITFTCKNGKTKNLYWAISQKENEWIIQGSISQIKERGGAVSDHKHGKDYFIYYGESSIFTVFSPDFIKWKKSKEPVLKPRPAFFDRDGLKFIASKVTEKGVLVFYDSSIKENNILKIQIGVAMFSLSDSHKIIWRSDEPIFDDQISYEKDFECKGMIFSDDKLAIYWYSKNTGILSASFSVPFSTDLTKEKIKILSKHNNNPVISPKSLKGKEWMSQGTFNPAAIALKDKVHLLFRAIGSDGMSRIGYASSCDGINFDDVHPEPVFSLKYPRIGDKKKFKKYNPVMYPSGGSWGGCEDPRMVNIDGEIYVTFNAFDSWDNIRVGMIMIDEEDFLNKNWKKWSVPKLISPKGRHKNWVIFPEKINGKFAILHNLHDLDKNKVKIDYVDDLKSISEEGLNFESPDPQKMPAKKISWHSRMRSVGTPPMKTEKGWLIFYHATDKAEPSKYKIGAMLLDLDDPTKIISRFSIPIITPDMWYENEGKAGIVYACGAVLKGDTLFIYYGGGDKFVCVATLPFKEFMDGFKNITEQSHTINKVTFS